MDKPLQIALWNALTIAVLDCVHVQSYDNQVQGERIRPLVRFIWIEWLKQPVDTIPWDWKRTHDAIRRNYFEQDWAQAYGLLEVVADHTDTQQSRTLKDIANYFMERENSAYRFVGNDIVAITDENEMSAVNEALADSPTPVSTHLQCALERMGDRIKPDYRNSVKESVSAVEAAAQGITGKKNATLGEALKLLRNAPLPQVLERAFSTLYGYASSEGGIRHALLDASTTVDEPEARFMLIACSAFVNYLRIRSDEPLK